MTQMKACISALELKRQLKVSDKTAWSMKKKIMQVMKERDDSKALSGIIQLDDVYWAGELRGELEAETLRIKLHLLLLYQSVNMVTPNGNEF